MWAKTCINRHPKECRKFNTGNGWRFQDYCAYKHSQKLLATNQSDKIAVAEVTVKPEDLFKTLKDELNWMKIAMKAMEDNIKSSTNGLTKM